MQKLLMSEVTLNYISCFRASRSDSAWSEKNWTTTLANAPSEVDNKLLNSPQRRLKMKPSYNYAQAKPEEDIKLYWRLTEDVHEDMKLFY